MINQFLQILPITVIIFFGISLINVILGTIKSIITVKSENKILVGSVNAITFGFYAIVIKQMVSFPILTTVLVTIIANYIGVILSMVILDKLKKDKLWKISATVFHSYDIQNLTNELIEKDIPYATFPIYSKDKELSGIDIYSQTQEKSIELRKILAKYPIKYHISEVKTSL